MSSSFNTYQQDTTIPIYIFLQYEKSLLKFPINPEALKIDRRSGGKSVNVEGLGEVNIPTQPALMTTTISSFFWQAKNLLPSFAYVNWLKKWQESKKPAKFIVTRLNYSMLVTCEDFNYEMRAGEENDIYFELQLKEYREFGAKKLKQVKATDNLTEAKRILSMIDKASIPILVDLPIPTRSRSSKEKIGNKITVKAPNTTLATITKQLTGATKEWKLLYEANKESLADTIGKGEDIAVGTELIVPEKWRG